MVHAKYQCQWCGKQVLLLVDESGERDQEWVEDCEFCCRPNVLHVRISEDASEADVESHRENE